MSTEFVVQIAVYAVSVGALYGSFRAEIKHLKADILRLEKKQDKHNNLVEKVSRLERDNKTAFSMLDATKEDIKRLEGDVYVRR
jgi:uncharacterized protein YdcH (DUF465 family)